MCEYVKAISTVRERVSGGKPCTQIDKRHGVNIEGSHSPTTIIVVTYSHKAKHKHKLPKAAREPKSTLYSLFSSTKNATLTNSNPVLPKPTISLSIKLAVKRGKANQVRWKCHQEHKREHCRRSLRPSGIDRPVHAIPYHSANRDINSTRRRL